MPESFATVTDALSPGAAELLALKRDRLFPCVGHFYKAPPKIVRARGCTVWDDEGRDYLDCYAGVTVVSAGHCEPSIVEAAVEQLRTLDHTTTIYLTEPMLRLADELARIAPGNLSRAFFCTSGSEAVEGALMLATLRTGRPGVVSFDNALHGRTRWASGATGLSMWRPDPFPLNNMWRTPFGDVEALADCLRQNSGRVACVIGEPVQGNGGVNTPPMGFWPEVRRLCDEHGCLLVLDEVQTGFNRTGRWFGADRYGVAPDVMAVSKALGNGLPIAAFLATDDAADAWTTPSASTYGGNPVCAAGALATLRFHRERDLGAAAERQGGQLAEGLRRLREGREDTIDAPRGVGLMWGLPLRTRAGGPDAARCDAALEALKDRGVLAGKSGLGRNVLTFMPPLTITSQEIAHALDALSHSL